MEQVCFQEKRRLNRRGIHGSMRDRSEREGSSLDRKEDRQAAKGVICFMKKRYVSAQ